MYTRKVVVAIFETILSTMVKEMDQLSPTHGAGSIREDCTHGRHLEIGADISWNTYM
jgi:hypothetical protein